MPREAAALSGDRHLSSVDEGLDAAVATLSKPVQPFSVADFNQAYGLRGTNVIGGKRLDSIDDITRDEGVRRELKEVYGEDRDAINRVDLLVGTLAEGAEVRLESFGFGETMFQVFILMASRRLFADRFFTEAFDTGTTPRRGWTGSTRHPSRPS